LLPDRPTRLVEAEKTDGNVNLAELGVIAKAAAGVEPGDLIVEIGTFDGRSTLNLAINSPAQCELFTLDLPPELPTHSRLEAEERKYVEKPYPGARFVNDPGKQEPATRKIHQLLGDSFVFDWSRYCGKAGLVFVDGSHAYEYVLKDSESALKLVRNGGCILWHDYGVWKGVTKGLEELEQRAKLGLTHVRGTSLVFART
jgi:predicted O-methyltransferase YrrM